MKYTNLFYFSKLNYVGGVESWLYYIARLYKDYDITVMYRNGASEQIRRLSRLVRCVKWDGRERIECDRLFVNYNPEILDYVTAKECFYMIHSDYKSLAEIGVLSGAYIHSIANDKRFTKFIAVSKLARKSFEEMTGVKAEVCYNPISLEEPERLLRLCSAQRMTKEKGHDRIRKLAEALDRYSAKNNVIWQWDIYTQDAREIQNDSIYYRTPSLNVNKSFGDYDYFVALSDNEGFCYSVVEALMRGTPCVVTPCPVFKELKLNTRNSITLQFDCSNADSVAERMFKKKFKFEYEPPKSNFEKYLVDVPTDYKVTTVYIKALIPFLDIVEGRTVRKGEVYEAEPERARYLIDRGLVTKEV